MNRTEKAEVISSIKTMLEESTAVYVVDYQGITVEDINNLRGLFKKDGITYKVLKNTFVTKAMDELEGYDELKEQLVGMNGFAFAGENFVAPAKIIKKYHKDTGKLPLKGCVLDGAYYSGDQLEALASMPSKEEVMASIVGSIAAPASGIVGAINAVMRDLALVVDEIAKQKEAA